MEEVNNINTRHKIVDRIQFLKNQGCRFIIPDRLESIQFDTNLRYVDSSMPQLIAYALLYSYGIRGRHSSDVIARLADENPITTPIQTFTHINSKNYLLLLLWE